MPPETALHTAPPLLDPASHAFFLDFDGTLAPIVPRPEDAAMPAHTREILTALIRAAGGAVAVLSGRALDDLRQRTAPLDLVLAGSHGLEISTDPSAVRSAALDEAFHRLGAFARTESLLIERKPGAVALHYRGRPDDLGAEVRRRVDAAGGEGLRVMHGDCVSEVLLADADKGRALRRLAQTAPFAGRVPVMIGDDVTDEDGIAAAMDLGGLGLRIGGGVSRAAWRLPDPEALAGWLAGCADFPKRRTG